MTSFLTCVGLFLLVVVLLIFVFFNWLFSEHGDNTNDEPWSFNNCDYRGDCLRDCPYRMECPFYTYKKEMGYE